MPRHRRIRSDDVEPMTLSPILLKINNPSKKKNKQQIYIYISIPWCCLSIFIYGSESFCGMLLYIYTTYVCVCVCVCVCCLV
ncbi:hypothetical protein HanPSC8_Chr06g0256281 [Helianthus annuus]|nr:hypothetical protein HanIR_Chr06g0285701 [Helianthus annuus]KAJ0915983.1 hypothetical protein HanPSC8_Chr06g0256281 [Helianthus annuus]